MGNPDGMEARWCRARHRNGLGALRRAARQGLLRKLLLPLNLLLRLLAGAACEIRRCKPDVVLGMGGYISFPGGMMAALLGKPLVLHEQNSVAGLANRVLAKVADRVLSGFPMRCPVPSWAGNPVRRKSPRCAAGRALCGPHDGPLACWWSAAASAPQALNETVPKALALIPDDEQPQVVHQAGEKHLAALRVELRGRRCAGPLRRVHRRHGGRLRLGRSGDLPRRRADGGRTRRGRRRQRAGAFPARRRRPPDGNARFLSQAGGAVLLPQAELTPIGLR
jgi:UDP-N-acetylglucosamine--N-acetylmuramyl-(pentapeptide) pyrophosphoryl-undecaprenol N-acetylglucosamine transferase